MTEYTILVLLASIIVIYFDKKLKTNLLRNKLFLGFLVVMAILKLFVNGYLTTYIVKYNPSFNLGIRISTIPIEDFLFGFSMIMFTIIIWEKLKAK